MAFLSKLDSRSRIAWHDVSQGLGDLAEDGIGREEALKRMHVRLPDGTLVRGAPAFVEIWERLPGFRRLAPLLRWRPIMAMLTFAYEAVLRGRRS
jgi:predicted DCC family thiol-disulfide oxidoreductase YuxK